MTKTETIKSHRSFFQPKNKSRRWKYTQPDLTKPCFICDSQIQVKYIPPKKQYSRKNNWGYWTQKEEDKQKYLCNSCLMKLHRGNMRDWIINPNRADSFYQYVWQGSFNK